MKSNQSCDLYILSAVTDLDFIEQTIPHQIRNCHVFNGKRNLIIDTAKISGYFALNRKIDAFDRLLEIAYGFKDKEIIDEVIKMDYNSLDKIHSYAKHFGKDYPETHCFRGYPYWGSILPIEHSEAKYIAHLDSDMIVYQSPDYSWIDEAIQLMEENPDILCVLPLSGPPRADGKLFQADNIYSYDSDRDAYLFKDFTSRIFVLNKERFLSLCPMKISWLSWREPFYSLIFRKGKMLCWEVTVTKALERSSLFRADLASPKAWSLHPGERGNQFNELLPMIIENVEKGVFPLSQAGHYDLDLDSWEDFLKCKH